MDDSRRIIASPLTANIAASSPANPIDAILQIIRDGERFLVCSHSRPDGDAVGSVLAMGKFLEQIGKRADLVTADRVPAVYRKLPGAAGMRTALRVHGPYDAAILLECDSAERTRLRGLERFSIVNIDHHASGRPFASINWIDEHACAVAAMVYRIAVAAKVDITPSMATALYAAILSDTGAFTYSSTTADTFALVHDLAAHGANPSQIARDIYFSNPASKIRLLGIALSNLQCDGNLAWTWVTSEDMDRIGAVAEDCEGVVNYLISIAGVESAVFLREVASQFRLSIRSKGKLDVAQIAEHFGGGGHRSASGCTLDGPLGVATERILTQLRTGLC
jgi:phosphoesterase RecJ-like protein